MNTHILIPIQGIEEKISEFRYESNYEQDRCKSSWLAGKADILEELLEDKQISLDEKDIEEKVAYKYPSVHMDYADIEHWRREGYKQALKDLL